MPRRTAAGEFSVSGLQGADAMGEHERKEKWSRIEGMTDSQLHILLKNIASRLEDAIAEVKEHLPEEMVRVRTVKPVIRMPNTPESWEVREYPVLFGLESLVSEIQTDAKDLREASLRQKVKQSNHKE